MKKKIKSTFASYGLDAKNNFLQAPRCDCGCGGYANLVLENDDDVCSFMYAMLEEHDCQRCGIFARKENNELLIGFKLDGEIGCFKGNVSDNGFATLKEARDCVAAMQEGLQLHCYGLLEQVDKDLYKIVMD